jgi:cobalt-zinc-cadmium efflux system outer membrane protein
LGDTLTIDAAIEQFVEHNYDLNIARHEAQKSHANLITAKERPNPTLNGSYEFMNINQHSIEGLLTKIVNRPDCKAAKENLALADASLRLEKANGIPNINIGMEYASFGPYYEPLAGLNFSVPLPLYDRNEGDIEKARIGTLQALPIYDKAIRNAQSDMIQTYEATQSRQRILHSMQEGFDSAKNLKENHEKIFILKGMSILELLDTQRSYREYQKNLIQATIDLHVSTAQLKLASGQLLTDSKGL